MRIPPSPTRGAEHTMTRLNRTVSEAGLADVATLVTAALGWKGTSSRALSKEGRISRVTVERIKRGERVSDVMLRALGDTLDFPRDFLLYVAYRDLDAIVRAGLVYNDEDLVRWTAELLIGNHGHPAVDTRNLHPRTREVLAGMGLV